MNLSDIASILYTLSVILYTVVSIKKITLLKAQNKILLGNLDVVTKFYKSLLEDKEREEEQREVNGKSE